MLKSEAWLIGLSPEQVHDPKKNGQDEAQNQARDNRKIKRTVAALVSDVAGKPSEAEREPGAACEKSTQGGENQADDEKALSKFA
jgi:hypothetical protein